MNVRRFVFLGLLSLLSSALFNYEAKAQFSSVEAAIASDIEARAAVLFSSGGKYMEQNCQPTSHQDWVGFPLIRCRYIAMNTTAEVTMLNPPASLLSRWIVSACIDAGTSNLALCSRRFLQTIWQASNSQFPVSGFVVEPASVIGGSARSPMCFPFRNGVTVRTANGKTSAPIAGVCAPASFEGENLTAALRFARMASTTRAHYLAFGGTHSVGAPSGLDPLWAEAIRREYQAAWSSNRNVLLSARAKAMKIAGDLP